MKPESIVLMEHPPKQELKRNIPKGHTQEHGCFNGTSTKTRIETARQAIEIATQNEF